MSSSAPDVAESSRAGQEAGAEQAPEPETQRKWVALVSVAKLLGNEDDERARKIVPDTNVLVRLDLNDPPLPSDLVLHPRVAPDPRRNDGPLSAYILAADRSGCIILQVVQGNLPDFFLCNTHTSTVTILPPVPSDIQANEGLHIRPHLSIGLIADPHHRGHFVVAQLHPATSDDHPNRLLYYSTAKGKWLSRGLNLQQARMRNPFSETGVLAHDRRLWWPALAYGVFFCDPFAALFEPPELRFLPLPDDCELDGDVAFDPRIRTLLDQRRCIRLSEGKLRFVEIRGLSYDVLVVDAPPANPTVSVRMWTLDDPEGPKPWTLEYDVPFAEIWDSETYADAGLRPREVPHVALVDPNDHYVVYFFRGSKLFGLDMREKKVVACEECLIDRDQIVFGSSRPIVDAWELPPPPPTLPGDDGSSPDDNVWSTQSYTEEKNRQVNESVDSRLNQFRLEWTRETDASEKIWRAWQKAPPPSEESSVSSGGQVDDKPDIQLPPFSVDNVWSRQSYIEKKNSVGERQSTTSSVNRSGCLVCMRRCDEGICSRCTALVKRNLLDISETVERSGDLLGYCIECHERVMKNQYHTHEGKTIPLDWYHGKLVAWVRGKEKWAFIFNGIQSDTCFRVNVGRPFLIHQPKAIRCEGCNDVLSIELLYGSLTRFCSLKCWMQSGGGRTEAAELAEILLATQFSDDLNAICLTCTSAFSRASESEHHEEHDWLAVITDSAYLSRIQIPPCHSLADVWRTIKGLGDLCWTGEILIKDDTSQRCRNQKCRARLVDGGGETCSLQCSVLQKHLLPRPLQLAQACIEP